MRDAMGDQLLGQVITYKAGNRLVDGCTFLLDAGTVKIVNGQPIMDPDWDESRWLASLDRYQGVPGCLFAVVPDHVGDAKATNALWAQWHGTVIAKGYRAAYVLQDGCESIPAWGVGAVFVGGSTEWKLGKQARELIRKAKRRGLWVHMGRVNSLKRLRYAALLDCDSVDGTYLAFGPDKNLPRLISWLHPAAPSIFGGVA